jgi:hypothetical protein
MRFVELGHLAVERGDYQEAVNIFKRVLEAGKDAAAFNGLGIASYHLGDLPLARWAFYQALELKPGHKEAYAYLNRIEAEAQLKPPSARLSRFRAGRRCLEFFDKTWKRIFLKGINMGLGLPGYFPGEFAVKRGTYLAWFERIAAIGVNAVRVYTLQPPGFYEALYRFNEKKARLFLLQGLWMELPEKNDFRDAAYLTGITVDLRNGIDAIYGNAVLPERPGYASGAYTHDVSPILAGTIIGREWESCAVKGYNELHGRAKRAFDGEYCSISDGTPFEVWITERCNELQRYELDRYGGSHPVSIVNWPTLDPLEHPTESTVEHEFALQGLQMQRRDECIEADDQETLDTAKIVSRKGNGFFTSYHVYPYFPDFMLHEAVGGEDGYLAYLDALKRHHGDQPVLIAEFGVPSSRDIAHLHPAGRHHGGHSDREQGMINGQLMRAVHESGMAGGVLFSWFDEWCKKTWLFGEYAIPQDRNPFWFNLQDPEQNYGLLATYPGYPGKKVSLACRGLEWADAAVLYRKKERPMVHRFHDGADDVRRLTRLSVQHDEGFLYLRLETGAPVDFSRAHYLIGLDTTGTGIGERSFPFRVKLLSPMGLTFLVHLAGKDKSRILAAATYDKYLNEGSGRIVPAESTDCAWVIMQNQTNRRRVSKDGKRFFAAEVANTSRLRFGTLEPDKKEYHSLADFFFSGNAIELRIPWGLVNVTDPSSKNVLWKEQGALVKKTTGIRVVALSYKPGDGLSAAPTGASAAHTDCFPSAWTEDRVKRYVWHDWNTPVYHTYVKESYHSYGRVLAGIPEFP